MKLLNNTRTADDETAIREESRFDLSLNPVQDVPSVMTSNAAN